MIKIVKEKEDYKNYNKIYIPQEYLNQNYKYNFNGDYILIRSNINCYTNYNNQYCNCYNYNMKENVISTPYECNYTSTSTSNIAYTSLTSDIEYSNRIMNKYYQDKGIQAIIIIIALILFIALVKESFK